MIRWKPAKEDPMKTDFRAEICMYISWSKVSCAAERNTTMDFQNPLQPWPPESPQII